MKILLTGSIMILLLARCEPGAAAVTDLSVTNTPTKETKSTTPAPTAIVSTPSSEPQSTSTLQSIPSQTSLGPDEFPQGYNPLTGRRVEDASLLDRPALLVSVSHFPPTVRPQGGLSFAPFVYEFTMTEGATGHLAVFYGELPEPEIPLPGDCEIRGEPFQQKEEVLGNLVWHDENGNGLQDPGEGGIAGICVNLYDEANQLLQQTATDTNGYYAFNVQPGRYMVEFTKPAWLEFTPKNAGAEYQDSDANQATGRTEVLDIPTSHRLLDAGLAPSGNVTPTPDPSLELPAAQIRGPCTTVPPGAMLDIERMTRIAEQNSGNGADFNYAGNLYSDNPPEGGQPALELREFWAFLNRSKWEYDAASQAWWRYLDEATPASAGDLHPEVDRLNSGQLMFENIILLFAEHTVIEPTIVDINLAAGQVGKAFLFRDGGVYGIQWGTRAGEHEQTTGLRRPIQFLNLDGTAAALRPGHTWVILFPFQSYLESLPFALWRARFVAPEGPR